MRKQPSTEMLNEDKAAMSPAMYNEGGLESWH